jgi:hypothetical protein
MQVEFKDEENHRKINLNRRKAIHEKCLNCSCWYPGRVTECTLKDCDLYSFRTGNGKQDADIRNKSIRDYCIWCTNGQVGEVTKCPSVNCSLFAYRKGGLERAITFPSFEEKVNIEGLFSLNNNIKYRRREIAIR